MAKEVRGSQVAYKLVLVVVKNKKSWHLATKKSASKGLKEYGGSICSP